MSVEGPINGWGRKFAVGRKMASVQWLLWCCLHEATYFRIDLSPHRSPSSKAGYNDLGGGGRGNRATGGLGRMLTTIETSLYNVDETKGGAGERERRHPIGRGRRNPEEVGTGER